MIEYVARRPKFKMLKFSGADSVPGILELLNAEAYTLTVSDTGSPTLEVCGHTLKYQERIVKDEAGKVEVMSWEDFNKKFELK